MNIPQFAIPLWTFGLSPLLAVINSAAMNIYTQGFFWTSVSSLGEYIPKSGTTGSEGNSVFN